MILRLYFGVIVTKVFDIMISFKLLTKAIVQLEPGEIAQWFYLIGNEYLMIYSNKLGIRLLLSIYNRKKIELY